MVPPGVGPPADLLQLVCGSDCCRHAGLDAFESAWLAGPGAQRLDRGAEPFAEPDGGRGQGRCYQLPGEFPCLHGVRVATHRAEDGPEGTIAVLGVGIRCMDSDVL